MDTCYIKRNPLQLNKAEAYYPHVYASKYKKIGIFCAITSVNRVQPTEVKQFYSNLPHKGCLVYQMHQFGTSRVISQVFGATR